MKTIFDYLVLALLVGILLCRCENEKQAETTISGVLVKHSECKSSLKSTETISDTLSCLQYAYDAKNRKLTVKHVNAGFNCCPGELSCSFSMINDTIVIKESEQSGLCNCNCLFDLDMEIDGVEAKKYQVKVVEPYAGDMEKLLFEIDLALEPESSFCITRKEYPWGVSMW